MINDEKYLTVAEFAALHGVCRERVHQLIREKKIEAIKQYGLWLIPENQEYKPRKKKSEEKA